MRDGEPSLRLDNSGDTPIQVPGIRLPQTAQLETNERFRHGLNDFSQDRLVAVEITMLAVMNNITDKPNWHRKIFDETILDKWRTEATAMPHISTKAWDWMMKELRDKAGFLEEHGFITTLDSGSPCAKGDEYVDDNTRNDLKAQVSPLIDVKDEEKDWHPNSDQKVLNLVHPSLFPLVYGCTQVLQTGRVGLENCFESCGKGVIPPRPDLKPVDNNVSALRSRIGGAATESRFSDRFQWLPAEVRFKESSDEPADVSVEITSYINNLHPVWHRGLYSTISKLIGKAVPMWNQMLVKGWHGRIPPRISVRSAENKFGIPEHLEDLWKEPEEEGFQEDLQKVLEYMAQPDHPDYDASKDDEEDEAYKNGTWKDGELEESSLVDAVRWKYDRICDVVHPDPGDNYSYQEWKDGKSSKTRGARLYSNYQRPILDHKYQNLRLEDEFRDQGLQVIVKLASIELTPENPSYDGGSWHLEGMLNEHIVATAIYYYDIENVSESLIDFRTAAELDDMELQYEQDEHEPLAKVFGIASGSMRQEPAIQHLGSLNCKDNRMIAFPNTLQHRVQPFKLLDPTRSGHRRFLVLWLVDPHYRIASTANVPPQQQHWVAPETVEKVLAQQDMANELKDMIREYANEGTMSLETAEELRLELMKERTTLMPHVEQNLPESNLCEH